jgi:hypothetical protein
MRYLKCIFERLLKVRFFIRFETNLDLEFHNFNFRWKDFNEHGWNRLIQSWCGYDATVHVIDYHTKILRCDAVAETTIATILRLKFETMANSSVDQYKNYAKVLTTNKKFMVLFFLVLTSETMAIWMVQFKEMNTINSKLNWYSFSFWHTNTDQITISFLKKKSLVISTFKERHRSSSFVFWVILKFWWLYNVY